MSRIGRLPIVLPDGVTFAKDGQRVTIKGPRGEICRDFDPRLEIKLVDGQLVVSRSSDYRDVRALHGLTRALLANMVTGVSSGYRKSLDTVGVGYRATVEGDELTLLVGYSHPVKYTAPEGITITVEKGKRIIHIDGIDKEVVGEVAAKIRAVRKPEPYKGKGIRYLGELVRRKAGKAGKVVGA
ncbi:MAG TPA: 50S ribosomal protein L6 [Anaerolineae bacterium]|nr:50S ribosomal protein L6 [Anaerolineae bacterium]